MKPQRFRTVTLARAIQRACLVFVPRDVRRAYRDEMLATFDAAIADAARQGSWAVWRLLFREVRDLATARRANRPAGVRFPGPATVATSGWPTRDLVHLSAWRQAWRSLQRRPAFLTAAVLTLGLGGGITTAVFSLVDTVLIRPLPYPEPDRLVTVYESSPSAREKTSLIAPVRLEDWNRLNRAFVALSGSYSENVTDTSGQEPERLEGRRVAPRFFVVHAMAPLIGRFFTDDEETATGPGAVAISERFWTRRFQRDPAAVGRALVIGGRLYPIVAVMPAAFTSAATDVWLPAQLGPALMRQRAARFLGGIGRLRPGVSLETGARDLASIQESLARDFPKTDAGWSVEIRSLKETRVESSRRGLVLVLGAVALLWVIAVANIAGLTLVQVHRRARELSIRSALGASRRRVLGTVMREGLLIALLGGSFGAGLAAWLIAVMPVLLSTTPRINELALDWRAMSFAGVTSLLAACVFSAVPAFAATSAGNNPTTGTVSRSVTAGRHRLQKMLVVGQVAVSVVLVGSATLLLRTYYNLTHVETGFEPAGAVTFHVAARWDEDRTRVGQLQEQLLAGLTQLPHVQAAGMTSFLPTTRATLRYQARVESLAGPNADSSMTVGVRMVSGGYLRAIRAPLVAGTWCPEPSTSRKLPLTTMVNRRFVEVHAPKEHLVGRTLRLTDTNTTFTITGVVGDLAEDGQATTPVPYIYTCLTPGAWPDPEYVARTSDPRAFAADLRRIVRELDSGRAVFGVRPLQDVLDAALDQPRLDATLLGVFAGAALSLAAIGLYSLFMLVVAERARELAVRLAIGAAPGEMVRLVMTGAGQLLAAGIVLGIALTAAADRLLRGALFGVSSLDAGALTITAATLAIVSAVAVAGPAIRAARIDPIVALRGE